MQSVFETEIGIREASVSFINTSGHFIDLKAETSSPDMILSVIHDNSGKVSSMALISCSSDELNEICLIDKFKAERISGDQSKAADLLNRFKAGAILNVPEMLASIWEGIKPIAVEAAIA